jgi:lipoprotein-anchoring transpeptidase ErfK/SrfK
MRGRSKALIGVGGVAVAAVAAAGAYAATQYSERPSVGALEVPSGPVLRTTTPTLRIAVSHASRLKGLSVFVDGAPIASDLVRGDGVIAMKLAKLPQGQHTISLRATDDGLFGATYTRQTRLTVDTTKPRLRTAAVPAAWSKTVTISGRSEPGARLVVTWKGCSARLTVPATGRYSLSPALPTGRTLVRLTATDLAGNTRSRKQWVRYDATAPAVALKQLPAWQKTESPSFSVPIDDVSAVRVTAAIDGKPLVRGTLTGKVFAVQAHDLYEGTHVVAFRATDAAGNVTTVEKTFGVQSTNTLTNDLSIGPGARGMVVKVLVRRLQSEGFWAKPAVTVAKTGKQSKKARAAAKAAATKAAKAARLPSHYDARVKAAVVAYQKAHSMPADGIARPALLQATAGRLVVYRSRFQVWVWQNGEHVATFPIAIGMPGHETPLGTYSVIEKIKNPTWIPPNSPWAAGLEKIPPGATNPLGPRWIGTSAPAIGFHGTPQDYSVATAASHGCMRMHFSDVIKLYDLVQVGEPVIINA